MAISIKLPKIYWALGDREPATERDVTTECRPLLYSRHGDGKFTRAGSIHPDYTEALMKALNGGKRRG